ncbi:MAG TPA: hypothetical protein VGK19_02285 [Capsulimonadaceae bacterium]|jgi:hypothetical protein
MKSRIMYIECKAGSQEAREAHIGLVSFSKTGRSLYYASKTFRRIFGGTSDGNYRDVETGESYWISGCKKRGDNRLYWERRIPVIIDEDVRTEYWVTIRNQPENVNLAQIW